MKYLRTKIGIVGLILMLVIACKSSNEKYTIEYNLPVGETLKQIVSVEANITQEILSQKVKSSLNINSSMSCNIKDINDGNYIVDMVFDAIKMDMSSMGVNISFDSNTDEEKASDMNFSPVFKAMTNIPVELVINKSGKIESVSGYEKIINAMDDAASEIDPTTKEQMFSEFNKQFSEQGIKEMLSQSTIYLPQKPVSIGEIWNLETQSSANIPMDISMELKLTNVKDNVATIEGTGNISTPTEGVNQEMSGMQATMNLKGTLTAIIEVDTKTGWIINANIDQNLNGSIEVMGMKIPMKMINTIKITN